LGVPGSSQAYRIAERHGVPRDVIEEALKGVKEEELDVARMIEKLERAQKQAQSAQGEADRLSNRVKELEREAQEKIAKAQEARTRAREDAAEELATVLRQLRDDAEEVFASLKPGAQQQDIENARARLKAIQQQGADAVERFKPKKEKKQPPIQQLKKGTVVRLVDLGQKGTVVDQPKGETVEVQVGAIKMKVRLEDVEFLEEPKPQKPKTSTNRLAKGLSAQREIHLRQQRYEDAKDELERFLDAAVLAGLPSVRIVHGKGEGVLRKMTRDLLQRHPHVKAFQDAPQEQGGAGATIAEFR
jgi:DNA mismatch repair protein MutS2